MLWNDSDLLQFFGNFESIDACDEEDDDSAYASDEEDQAIDQPDECTVSANQPLDPTKCMKCRIRKFALLTSCGHFSCGPCWDEWLAEETTQLDASNEPAHKISKQKKYPKCVVCKANTSNS